MATNSSQDINPYTDALKLVYHRARFDLDYRTWRSQRNIKKLGDSQKGGKCVILCNGPSLNQVDFDALHRSGVFTIGLNKINMLFDRSAFRPSLIACINPHVIEQNLEFYLSTNIPLYLDYRGVRKSKALAKAGGRDNIHLLHSANVAGRFGSDLRHSVCQGFTVTYFAFQIAYYLGLRNVALVGCDHNFASKGTANKTIVQEGVENNHFIANYFPPGAQWQLPDLLGSEFHYQVARDHYALNDRHIWNCTVGGKLELFPRISLGDFIEKV